MRRKCRHDNLRNAPEQAESNNGQPDIAVAVHDAHVFFQVGEREVAFDVECGARALRVSAKHGQAPGAECLARAEHDQQHANGPDIGDDVRRVVRAAIPALKGKGKGKGAAQYGDDGERLHNAIRLPKPFHADDGFNQPIFCRRINGALRRQRQREPERRPEHARIIGCQHRHGNTHGNERGNAHHARFVKLVADESRGRKQQHEGYQYHGVHHRRERNQL